MGWGAAAKGWGSCDSFAAFPLISAERFHPCHWFRATVWPLGGCRDRQVKDLPPHSCTERPSARAAARWPLSAGLQTGPHWGILSSKHQPVRFHSWEMSGCLLKIYKVWIQAQGDGGLYSLQREGWWKLCSRPQNPWFLVSSLLLSLDWFLFSAIWQELNLQS